MVKQVIGIGTAPDDGLGDPIRTAFTKSNDNFTELYDVLPAEVGATADQSDAEIETAYNNQVGAVSQVVAEAGTDTAITRWTAQRVAQAIAALASGSTTELSRTLGYNGTGGTLVKGKPVLFSGIQGSDPAIISADSDGTGTMPAIGVVQTDIADTATGYVVTDGPVTGLDTSTWTAKDALYVSDTGVLTSTVPANSDDTVQEVARVVYSHATTGIIIVQPRIAGSPLIDGASWKDNNDNEVFEVGVVASAVNHPQFKNAATGNAAEVNAVGGDTNIDLSLLGKGTGWTKGPAIPIGFALSDDSTALTTGIKWTWYAPAAGVILDVHAGVKTAPTTTDIIVDIHKGGTTIMTTDKLDIELTENDTTTAATQPALTTTAFAKGDKFEFEIDQIGSGAAGAGLTATMIVRLT